MKSQVRLRILQILMTGSLVLLSLSLFHTQIIKGGHFRKASEKNRIRLIRLEAPRGNIYDRNGILLATSRPSYDVYAIPEDVSPKIFPVLGKLIRLREKEIRLRLSEARQASFTPVLLKRDVAKKVALRLEELSPDLAGVFIHKGTIRSYPQGEVGAHIVGYIGKISPEEFKQLDSNLYHFGSWIGRAGIERAFDARLRGEDGGRQLEVDARGMPIRLLGEREPVRGEDIHLTLDSKLEQAIRPLLKNRRSAVLLLDLEKGGMISAVSTPGFDPNTFVTPELSTERLALIGSKARPLFDRSLNGLYPPGSIFKLVTAMAALETGTITPYTTFNCPGYFRFNSRSRPFKCWFHEGHGRVDLYTAIERSCNVYFYNVGKLLGEKRLSDYAKKLGFGNHISFELQTADGLVPDAEWKKKIKHESWYGGETISFAIGQSYLLVSPLQILRMISIIATDGRIADPYVLEGVRYNEGLKNVSVRNETFNVLRQGMLKAVASDRGTGQLARVNFMKISGKTGTAQAPPGEPHAWFGGFFPFDQPKVAFVIMVERGKSGGMTCTQIGKEIFKVYHELYGPAVS